MGIESPIKYVCKSCGSDDLLFDAWARWNPESQRMELVDTLDMVHCNKCDGETRAEAVEA